MNNSKPQQFFSFIIGIALTISVGAAVYFYTNYNKVLEQSKVAGLQKQEESKEVQAKKIIESFSKIYNIKNEDPTIASVTDVDKLKKTNPNFYEDAKDGDKLIILTLSKMAVLYRVEENKIINIAFVDFGTKK